MNNKRQFFFVIASVHAFLFSGNFSDDKWQIGQARVTANRVDISFTLLIIGTILLSIFNFLFFFFNFAFNTQTFARSRFQLVRAGFDHCKEGLLVGRFCCNRQYWVQDQSARHHRLRHLARSGRKYMFVKSFSFKYFFY